MSASVLEVSTIGPIIVVSSQRAKHVRITISADRTVKLTVPEGVSSQKAQRFLHSKIRWIEKHLQRLEKLKEARRQLRLPPIDRAQAEAVLVKRLEELARLHGFRYNKVSIRNQKTKWASCSTKNNISLNAALMRLPDDLKDYVILHELLHTRIRNHSKRFWSEMDELVGDGKALQKQLRRFDLGS